MLKIKLKHTNPLDFISSSLFCLENDKLSWNSYWHKNSSYKCIHISALQSRKLRLRESTRLTLSSVLVFGVHEFKRPLDCFQKHSYIHSGHSKEIGSSQWLYLVQSYLMVINLRIKMYWKKLSGVLKILQIYQELASIEINNFK